MINLRAMEDVIDDAIPQCRANWEAAKGKPQYTPAEIAECYPDLNKEAIRGGYIRFFSKLKKERPEEFDDVTEHVQSVIKQIPRLRAADRVSAWFYFSAVYPTEKASCRKQMFIDFVLNFCIPSDSKAELARELEEESDQTYDYEAKLHREYNTLTPEALNEYLKQFMARAKELEQSLAESYHVRKEDELGAVQAALNAAEIIQRIWDGDFYSVFGLVEQQYAEYVSKRVAAATVAPIVLNYLVVYAK